MIIEYWARTNQDQDFILDIILLIVEFAKLFEKFDVPLSYKGLMIENEGLIVRSIEETFAEASNIYWRTAIGTRIAEPRGKYTWKLKLVKGTNIFVGFIADSQVKDHAEYWWSRSADIKSLGLYTNGDPYRRGENQGLFYPDGELRYAEHYNEGDIITVCLDLKNGEISYGRNEIDYGVIPKINVPLIEYRLAIAFYKSNAPNTVEILCLDVE